MFLGHYALALATKRIAPKPSLGTTFLAAEWADLLWPTFLLLGWEKVRIEPGATAATPLVFESYPISHSLIAMIGWGFLLGAIYWLARRDFRSAVVVGLLVPSHWVLDAIVHVPDLPLVPGGDTLVGLGLWNWKAASVALELVLLAVGAWLYAKATWSALDKIGKGAFVSLIAFLTVIQLANSFGAPPPSVDAVAWVTESMWLLVAWGYWIESRVGRTDVRP
jgi:hypothetical protein